MKKSVRTNPEGFQQRYIFRIRLFGLLSTRSQVSFLTFLDECMKQFYILVQCTNFRVRRERTLSSIIYLKIIDRMRLHSVYFQDTNSEVNRSNLTRGFVVVKRISCQRCQLQADIPMIRPKGMTCVVVHCPVQYNMMKVRRTQLALSTDQTLTARYVYCVFLKIFM